MSHIDEFIKAHQNAIFNLHKDIGIVESAAERIYETFNLGNKLLIFGNGGSAADAQHIAGELVGRFKRERKGLPAMALTTDTSIITAWSNDYAFDSVFSRQVEAFAKPGDFLWGISTSGNSPNVLYAFDKGRGIGTFNFSMTGGNGGQLKKKSDLNLNISSDDTPRIQEAHMLAYHLICGLVEDKMFGDSK
ncbi:MAG: D-sedoheptulose 7-phosphate isomerase [Candidatus Magasanikbacteria bacterium]|nr:D-sedoheptulose 7-phosphate isomerase [Candidatus Magasanikbacteria bacterium]